MTADLKMTKGRRARTLWLVTCAVALVAGAAIVIVLASGSRSSSARGPMMGTSALDSGAPLRGAAPGFTLADQFGQLVSLRSYRGQVVLLAFTDSNCTTICPLTTSAMVDAKRLLGPAGSRVALLGVNANPTATSVGAVRAYSKAHDMMGLWRFLTGSRRRLDRVWREYRIEARVVHGQIDHTPALFVIDPKGVERRVYLTQMNYAAVDQLAGALAREASSLLPGHPAMRSVSYSPRSLVTPDMAVMLPGANGGAVRLGPSSGPRLNLFFDTWLSETSDLADHLEALSRYQAAATAHRLPPLVAIDEATVEPSSRALPRFLHNLPRPLPYPVAIDSTGRVADGYQVEDEPWLELTSASGQILWYLDPSTAGWPTTATLLRDVRTALARAQNRPTAGARQLAGSPPPLAALHRQAGQLLGGGAAFAARVRGLRGYPIVINTWASWCTPCRREFGLLASASARYGRKVAFLGADADDSPGGARPFLRQHPVNYPSYGVSTADLSSLAAIPGLPTTFVVSPAGKVVFVHPGQYATQKALDRDIETYALGR